MEDSNQIRRVLRSRSIASLPQNQTAASIQIQQAPRRNTVAPVVKTRTKRSNAGQENNCNKQLKDSNNSISVKPKISSILHEQVAVQSSASGAWTPSKEVYVGRVDTEEIDFRKMRDIELKYSRPFEVIECSVIKLQRWYRKVKSYRTQIQSAIVIQQYCRQYLKQKNAIQQFEIENNAAIKIQANVRLYIVRLKYVRLQRVVSLIQSRWRFRQFIQRRENAAICIQIWWRKVLNRQRQLQNKTRTVIVIQRWFRRVRKLRFYVKVFKAVYELRQVFQLKSKQLKSQLCSDSVKQQLLIAAHEPVFTQLQYQCRRYLKLKALQQSAPSSKVIILKKSLELSDNLQGLKNVVRVDEDHLAVNLLVESLEISKSHGSQSKLPLPQVSGVPLNIDVSQLDLKTISTLDKETQQKILDAVRQKKQLLAENLQSHSNGNSKSAQSIAKSGSSNQQRAGVTLKVKNATSTVHQTQSYTMRTRSTPAPKKQQQRQLHIPVGKSLKQEQIDLLMQNLHELTQYELDQLTEANTSLNKKYHRPLKYKTIYKHGAKPASPNAKTLARFAAISRKENDLALVNLSQSRVMSSAGAGDSQAAEKRIQWNDSKNKVLADNKTEIYASATPVHNDDDAKENSNIQPRSCLKPKNQSKQSIFNESSLKVPVIIQKFVWDQFPIPQQQQQQRLPQKKQADRDQSGVKRPFTTSMKTQPVKPTAAAVNTKVKSAKSPHKANITTRK
ncbi:hypothetical protein MIR68_000125 [Amoeboaphelidium protococcarum]|nr:hypothetical protein MIR68_000125 [Amoeboaphelidium protococcarum]